MNENGESEQLRWVAIDLDGTLARTEWTPENPTHAIGTPIWDNVHKAHRLYAMGYKIIIHTSRPWSDYERIESWLRSWEVPFKMIQCGKLLAAIYVDDRAVHSDSPKWLLR